MLPLLLLACTKPAPPEPAAPPEPPSPPAEVVAAPVAPANTIVDKLLPFSDRRRELTVAYLRAHVDPERTDATLEPKAIVLHWTAVNDLEQSWAIFAPEELQGRPDIDDAGRVNVSAHFLVDRDGTIYRLMPDDLVARHVIGLNQVAIGVENVGVDSLTEAQLAANIALVRHLRATHPGITHLLGHLEYQQMEGHPYFQEIDPDYRTTKVDPGADFMTAVRTAVADLGLAAPDPSLKSTEK